MLLLLLLLSLPNESHEGVPVFVGVGSDDLLHDPRRGLQQLRALALAVRDRPCAPPVELVEDPADLHERRVVDLHGHALRDHLALPPAGRRLVLGLQVGELCDRKAPLPGRAQALAAGDVPGEEGPLLDGGLLGLDTITDAMQTTDCTTRVCFTKVKGKNGVKSI